jgi:hypothetical protein
MGKIVDEFRKKVNPIICKGHYSFRIKYFVDLTTSYYDISILKWLRVF